MAVRLIKSITLLGLILRMSCISSPAFAQTAFKGTVDQHTHYKGSFKIYNKGGRYYFEIPDPLLNRELLVVTRVTKAATNHPGSSLYSGDIIGQRIIQFELGLNNKLFVKEMAYSDRSTDSSTNGMHASVSRSNLQPIVATFNILPNLESTAGITIDFTEIIGTDNTLLFFDQNKRSLIQPGSFDLSKSYLVDVRSSPNNIEMHTVMTYNKSEQFFTYEFASSIILLNEQPMKPRYYDNRIGYLSTSWNDFDLDPHEVKSIKVIKKWRMEPKQNNIERYKKGILVEPKNPIIFYVDPTMPKKWVPYIIAGVDAWQKAFEKAGFKNAIFAKSIENSSDLDKWEWQGIGVNRIIWNPSTMANANGSILTDPRTGEILSASVRWYHNEMKWNHDNYFVLASPTDPGARLMHFSDSLIGTIITSVISHEIGHTLGLVHNFSSSSTIPVEKLRDKEWVKENGFCPSIMDYARYNYVAQPEDDIPVKDLQRRIGKYDEWAIEWGYRWFPEIKNYGEEKQFMDKWIVKRLKEDKRLFYGESGPENMTEDLGDNSIIASFYGINNLKRIIPRLEEWTKESYDGDQSLKLMYQKVFNQYVKYLDHVIIVFAAKVNIDGISMPNENTIDFSSGDNLSAAVRFLQEQLFTTPLWLMDRNIYRKTGEGGMFMVLDLQESALKKILTLRNLRDLLEFENLFPESAYTGAHLLNDLKGGIWSELTTHQAIDMYRRNLQKVYTNQLIYLLKNSTNNQVGESNVTNTDIPITIENHILSLIRDIDGSLPSFTNNLTIDHLQKMRNLLRQSVDQRVP